MTTALFVLVLTTVLAGCSPPTEVGVRLDERGRLLVESCGTWIDGVNATDAETGRIVWSAHAPKTSSGGRAGQDSVTIGEVPSKDWVEDVPLAASPRPATWRFSMKLLGKVVATDKALRSGRMFRPGTNQSESVSHFDEQTCSGLPISASGFRLVFGLLVLGAGAAAIVTITRRRRNRSAHSQA